MVVFTCNHCGEAVKKPAVEKHYKLYRCRNLQVSVSCMDCLKDFHGEEFVAHTKCITEAEKYSGKDYVPKESQNKGQRKQDSWLEIVRSILTSKDYNLLPNVKAAFQRLEIYDNVPRKQAKFKNFVANSLRIKPNEAAKVWEILEKELLKLKASKNAGKENGIQNGDNESNGSTATAESTNNKEISENGKTPELEEQIPKKKKKIKKRENGIEEVDIKIVESEPSKNGKNEARVVSEVVEQEGSKSKKSKQKRQLDENNEFELNNDTQEPTRKRKKSINVQTNNGTELAGKFDWTDNIFKILAKHNDEINLEKLRKKVLKKYKSQMNVDEIPYKIEKTFNKKLKKSGLCIDNDVVKYHVK